MGNADDAPVSFNFINDLLKTEDEGLDDFSRGTPVPAFDLLCAAACTMPVCLVQIFKHGQVAAKC